MFPDPGARRLVQAAIDSVHDYLCKAKGQHHKGCESRI